MKPEINNIESFYKILFSKKPHKLMFVYSKFAFIKLNTLTQLQYIYRVDQNQT